jgi:hypothetical protein
MLLYGSSFASKGVIPMLIQGLPTQQYQGSPILEGT